MATNYDELGALYGVMKTIPLDYLNVRGTQRVLGDLCGLHILDLACGSGYYSRKLLEWGAATVVGVDLSGRMVQEANAVLATTPDLRERLEYHVGDVSKAGLLQSLSISNRQFDLVHGAWLLNYASTPPDLVAMWRNIASALKPGGRFVGLVPNVTHETFGFDAPLEHDKYKIHYTPVEKIEHGYRFRCKSLTEPPIEFENFFLNEKGLYERCAKEAGMTRVEFDLPKQGDEETAKYAEGFLDEYVERPYAAICIAVCEISLSTEQEEHAA